MEQVILNPFLKGVKIVTKIRSFKRGNISKATIYIGDEKQELINPAIHSEEEYVSVQFIQIHGGHTIYYETFTYPELIIFGYLTDNLVRYNCDFIIFNHTSIREHLKLNRGSTYSFIKKMIELKVLLHREGDVYWLNPYKIYKGNRKNLKHW